MSTLEAPRAVQQIAHVARQPAALRGGNRRRSGRQPAWRIQRKVVVGAPADRHEVEADRIADLVLNLGRPIATHEALHQDVAGVLRRCPGGCPSVGCSHDEMLQRQPGQGSAGVDIDQLESSLSALRHKGRPLPQDERSFFESRFGRDFSSVRVHTGAPAAAAARVASARAFTIGNDIVFGSGQYRPGTPTGRQLIAHELVHTVQQGAVGRWQERSRVQRAVCPPTPTGIANRPIERSSDCPESSSAVRGAHLRFCTDSVVLKDESELRLPRLIRLLKKQPTIPIHGYASREGPRGREAGYNLNLSCRRANRVADLLAAAGIPRGKMTLAKHGGTTEFGPDEENRAVVIPIVAPTHFRVAAASFLACAPCNPYTDDTAAVALTPPATEPAASGFGYRQLHWLEGEIRSADGMTIDAATITDRGSSPGHSGYCGASDPATQLSATMTSGVKLPGTTTAPESYVWGIEMSTRVNATVPATLPGSPCGPLGRNPGVPPIFNRVLVRAAADGSIGSSFLAASGYPFHYLYEDRALKMFAGSPVHPAVNFPAWATSAPMLRLIAGMGFSPLAAAVIGFSALRFWCCNPLLARALCPTICAGGITIPDPAAAIGPILGPPGSIPLAAAPCAMLVGKLVGCYPSCKPAGAACPTPTMPSNP